MPVYRKHGKPEYTYDFQLRGRRFFGPTGTSNRRQAERILEQKREEVRAKLKAAASFTRRWTYDARDRCLALLA